MKVKLLKKLRKRFIFFYDRDYNGMGNPWKVFDKNTKRTVYSFVIGLFYYSEMSIYDMLHLMGMGDIWVSNRQRADRRRTRFRLAQQERYFMEYAKSRKL